MAILVIAIWQGQPGHSQEVVPVFSCEESVWQVSAQQEVASVLIAATSHEGQSEVCTAVRLACPTKRRARISSAPVKQRVRSVRVRKRDNMTVHSQSVRGWRVRLRS